MEVKIETLKEITKIATDLQMDDLVLELEQIIDRLKQPNAELFFPLIGEFSSGKTTLINALTDSKKMETATKPTTSTIYEVHFGCDKCYATVLDNEGQLVKYDDIAELKNEALSDSKVVCIYDTSLQVSPTTVLIDTPGLSSPDPKHRQTLVDFLPYADGVLLVIDVNQQITKSLTEFIKTIQLAKRPIYLIITKTDTKSPMELEDAKAYIAKNSKLPIEHIACVSAFKNDLADLYALLEIIQKNKNITLKLVNEQRSNIIVQKILSRIELLLKASSSDKELEEAISSQESELKALNRRIKNMVNEAQADIESMEQQVTRNFESIIMDRLDTLVAGKSDNFDSEAQSIINNNTSILFNDYKTGICQLIQRKARSQHSAEDAISINQLDELGISDLSITGLNYNINLNSVGHQYDGIIATGVKVAAAVGTVAAVVSTGGGALVATAATAAVKGGNIIDIADTASDVASVISNNRTAKRIEKAIVLAEQTRDKFNTVDKFNQEAGQQIGGNKGIVESMVGFFSDKMGKPQRRKMIQNYMDESLVPDFKRSISSISNRLVTTIETLLHNKAAEIINQKRTSLEELKKDRTLKKEIYDQKIRQLRDYKNELINRL